MKHFTAMNFATMSLILFMSGPSFAQNNSEMRTESIRFDDELVEGELRKPELFYLLQKKQFNYKRLIKLRENFLPEMRRDAEKIPVGRAE